ncbi:MAG: hypothetical protein ACFFER_14460 [Candidatus Thorarchaeota archaeon]
MSRAGLDFNKRAEKVPCPKCRKDTLLYVMKKMAFENLKHVDPPRVIYVKPGEMYLPDETVDVVPPKELFHGKPDFLEVKTTDNIFSRLVSEINTCVANDAFSSAFIMVRKLIENLLIAMLRAKYGENKYEIYFDDDSKHFRPLSKIIEEFERDFEFYRKLGLEKEHISRIKRFKGIGNYSAHNIIDLPTEKKIQGYRKDANDVIHLLLHLLDRVEGMKK